MRLVERERSAGGTASMTNAWTSGVAACINDERHQNDTTATPSRRSAPSVTRNGSDSSSDAVAVRSLPKRRATTGPRSAAAAVHTCAIEKNRPICALEHWKRVAKY